MIEGTLLISCFSETLTVNRKMENRRDNTEFTHHRHLLDLAVNMQYAPC